jgi:transposase
MEERQQKGMMIAATMKIQQSGNAFVVPSQTDPRGRYAVDGVAKTCSCPDFTLRQKACKHVHAVEFYLRREVVTSPSGVTTVTETTAMRVTYAQNWPAYNQAQSNEKAEFLRLLRDLCDGIENPPQASGRPRLPLGDQVFCATFKVYSGRSARRFSTDIRTAHEDGLLSDAPAYNSVLRYLEDESLTPIISDLITQSAVPLRGVETQFAVDSTGIGTQCFYRHYAAKYGHDREKREFVKLHALVGTKTNIIAACKVTDRENDHGDVSEFQPLVRQAAQHFEMKEVSADLAYSSYGNLELVESIGAVPYIPFKSSAKPAARSHQRKPSATWTRLYHYFQLNRDEFLEHYHRRSNVETVFSMMKRCVGDTVRSRTRVAQVNEVLLMALCHNIRVLIHEMHELGIQPALSVSPTTC